MNPNDYDAEDEQDEQQPEAATPAGQPTYQPAPQAALPNPVIRSFDGPVAAATNTTPAAPAQPAAPQPASAQPASEATTPQPTSQPQAPQPVASTPAATPQPFFAYEAAASASTGRPPVTEEMSRENQRLVDEMYADQKAKLAAHKAAGGQTETLFNGYEIKKQDEQGNDLYHPTVVQPFTRLADGEAYRVSRNEYGTQHYFPLAQGQEGADYHVDPATGDKYVQTTGADGGSRREIIGQDATIPALNNLKQAYQNFGGAKQSIDLDEARATNGVQGGTELQAKSVGDLRDESRGLNADVTQLTKQLANALPDDPATTTPGTISANQQLADQLAHKKQRLGVVQQELDGRDSIIADARQRRDALTAQHIDTNTSLQVLQKVRGTGGLDAYRSDLTTLAQGGTLRPDEAGKQRVALLTNLGLLKQEATDDGTGTEMRLTPAGVAALEPHLQQAIAADPGRHTVTDEDAPVDPRLARAGQNLAALFNPAGSGDASTGPVAQQVAAPGATGVVAATLSGAARAISPLAMYEGKVLAPPQAQQRWRSFQAQAVLQVPDIGVAGSPANLAFVREFRASGGDAKQAMQAAKQAVL